MQGYTYTHTHTHWSIVRHMGMDQYLLIPFLGGWTSIYQLFWCSPGVQGFDTLPYDGKQYWCACLRISYTHPFRPLAMDWNWVGRCLVEISLCHILFLLVKVKVVAQWKTELPSRFLMLNWPLFGSLIQEECVFVSIFCLAVLEAVGGYARLKTIMKHPNA